MIKILLTKTYKVTDNDEPQDVQIDLVRYTEEIVKKWIDRKNVAGVRSIYDGEVVVDLSDYNMWLSEPRVSGTNTLRVEVFFTVETDK